MNFWCWYFFTAGKFSFLGHLQVVSKALFWVKAPFINDFFYFQIQVWSQLTHKKENNNSKLSSEIQNRRLSLSKAWKKYPVFLFFNFVAFSENLNFTCQVFRHGVHKRCPQGSILISLLFSAQILHNWNVELISQYISYCSFVTLMWSSGVAWTAQLRSGFTFLPSGFK